MSLVLSSSAAIAAADEDPTVPGDRCYDLRVGTVAAARLADGPDAGRISIAIDLKGPDGSGKAFTVVLPLEDAIGLRSALSDAFRHVRIPPRKPPEEN